MLCDATSSVNRMISWTVGVKVNKIDEYSDRYSVKAANWRRFDSEMKDTIEEYDELEELTQKVMKLEELLIRTCDRNIPKKKVIEKAVV